VNVMHLIYDIHIEGFSTLLRSMETAFQMMLGKFDVSQLVLANPILGPIIFSTYISMVLFFVLNIFISIITDAFDLVRKRKSDDRDENILKHAWDYLKRIPLKQQVLNGKFMKDEKKKSNQPVYQDYLGIFPKRVDSLIDHVFVVRF